MLIMSSEDCDTTEKKIDFMQRSLQKATQLFISERTSSSNIFTPCLRPVWNFDQCVYEIHTKKLTDAGKYKKILDAYNQNKIASKQWILAVDAKIEFALEIEKIINDD